MNHHPRQKATDPLETLKAVGREKIIHIRKGCFHAATERLIIRISS